MEHLIYKIEDLQFDIELFNAHLSYLKDKYFENLREENMELAYYYIKEIEHTEQLLDRLYKRQEKAYKDLLILYL